MLSGLLSWAAGALLLQGALLPRAGELLKSSSSSRPLVASYCVFSRRVIKRSSSSPNSPPIRVGSPTTITSLGKRGERLESESSKTHKCSYSSVHIFKRSPDNSAVLTAVSLYPSLFNSPSFKTCFLATPKKRRI